MQTNMKKAILFITVLVFMFFVSGAAFSQSTQQRIDAINSNGGFMVWKAESAKKSKVDWGVVDALVPVPAEKVIELLRDYNGYKRFLKFFTMTKVQETLEDHSVLRLKATIAGGTVKLKATARIWEDQLEDGTTHFKLRYRRGNVNRLDGDWFVTPLEGGKCLVKMRLLVDPDLWLVSNSQLSEYNLVNSRRTLRSIKKMLAPGK